MRLSPVVPTLAGLLFAWAVAAQADAPPAAPIFYCPAPGKAAPAVPAKTPAKPVAAPVVHASAPHAQGCPTMRVAAEHPHWRREERRYAAAPPRPAPTPRVYHRHEVADADVSAAQAFIYRYERARRGLDAGAADQAWVEGRRGPPMGGHLLAQRQTPPPPMPAPQARAYAWQDGHAGAGYSIQRSERAGGWSYSEQDGRGRYHHWGDHFAGELGHGWGGGPERPVPCPRACGGPREQAEVYETAGRDVAGFLTWPGKTPGW